MKEDFKMNENKHTNGGYNPDDLLKDYESVPVGGSEDAKIPIVTENFKTAIYIDNTADAGELLDTVFGHIMTIQGLTDGNFPFDENSVAEGMYLTNGGFINICECTPIKIVGEEERREDTEQNDAHLYVYPYMEMIPFTEEQKPKPSLVTFTDEEGNDIPEETKEEPREYAQYITRLFIMGDSILCHWSDGRNELFVVREKIKSDIFHILV